MDAAVLVLTSTCIFEHILECFLHICLHNFEIFQQNKDAVPAVCIQAFINGSIGIQLPGPKWWADAYHYDPQTATSIEFVQNPWTISNKGLEDAKLNTNFLHGIASITHHDGGQPPYLPQTNCRL
jgi:hypothetical protein